MTGDVNDQSPRYCISCRHSLRGIASNRCPECGREFDPENSRTFARTPEPDLLTTLSSAARYGVWISGAVTLITLYVTATYTLGPMWMMLIGIMVFPALLIQIIISLISAVTLSRQYRMLSIILPILIVSMGATYWPFKITWATHLPHLNATVERIENGDAMTNIHGVGLLRFRDVSRHRDGNIGFQLSGGSGGGVHLVRAYSTQPFIWYNTNWEIDLGGGWWLVAED